GGGWGDHAAGAGGGAGEVEGGEVRPALHPPDAAGTGLARVDVVEPVNVGEQDQRAGPDDVGDERREPVIVAEPDLVGGDRVVLVDHRQYAQFEQAAKGALGVAVVRAPHQVVGGKQDLAGLNPSVRE